MDHISKFIEFMRSHGMEPASSADIVPDDKWRDIQLAGDARGKKKGFYTLRVDGDFISGAFGDRRTGEVVQYKGKPGRKLTDAERREYVRRRKEDADQRQKEALARQEAAAVKAAALWKEGKTGSHDYLTRKAIDPKGSRVKGDLLLIPMYSADGKLWGVQSIDKGGGKMFLPGGRKKGCYCPIADKENSKNTLYICEGFATGATIRQATGGVVIVAFDAGNLEPVAQAMREKYPAARIIICGDNDHLTEGNPGVTKATEAAQAVGGIAVWPEGIEGTDFNDMAAELGLAAVKDSVAAMVADRAESNPGAVVAQGEALGPQDFAPIEAYEGEFKSKELDEVKDWAELLICDGKGNPVKTSLRNIILFLEHHDHYRGIFKFNEFAQEITVAACPKWESEAAFKVHRLDDVDISQAAASLESLGVTPDTNKVFKAIQVVADKNKFHPAREYFNGLKWDGQERLKSWLTYYMGCEDDDPEYLSFIGRKWLTAAVKRVFEPGCKFDHVLVMEGKQGRGKSTALKVLATFGEEIEESYFTDSITIADILNKDTIAKLQGSIIVELAELAGFNKKDDEEIKRWVTLQHDDCRLPYARLTTRFSRQFVLSATTNSYDYLKDPTGNRRYWPCKTGGIDLRALNVDKAQLWAEAVYNYRNGLYIGPTDEEMALAARAQDKRRAIDTWEDDVLTAISGLGLSGANGFSTRELFAEMGLGLKDRDYKNTRRITNILQQNGYMNEVRRHDGKIKRVWVRE